MLNYNKLNIIHVAPQLGGGVASVIEQLTREQMRLGANVVVVHPESSDVRFNSDGINLKKCPARSIPGGTMLLGVPYWKAPLGELRSYPTVVHYHGLAGQGCLGVNRHPSVCTLHGVSALSDLSPIRALLVKMGFRRRTRFVAVDPATASFFSGFCQRGIGIIPNGLPSVSYDSRSDSPGSSVISFVGNLDDLKGFKFALDAAKLLRDRGLEFKMLFAGPVSNEDLVYFNNFCKRYNLQGRVEYLGIVKDAGASLIPKSDIILLPSRTEGFPMSLLEALRAGKSILATNVGGIPELLRDGENGFFIQRDGIDIADKAGILLGNPKLLDSFSKRSKEFFEEDFRIEDVCDRYLEEYSRAIELFDGQQ